jgi:MoxR-like ATPase
VLADEINRAPAKVQSALLEAMQERQVTIGETSHKPADPFMVMATQNPIEQEGTYPLPEAQLDRFMLLVKVGYPTPRRGARHASICMSGARSPTATARWWTTDAAPARKRVVNQMYIDDRIAVHRRSGLRDPRAALGTAPRARRPHRVRRLAARHACAWSAPPARYAFLKHRPT